MNVNDNKSNWRLTVEYDGRAYHGWQRQPRHRSIQAELERALSTALRETVRVIGSGRTDAGVHAVGQIANFRTAARIDPRRLCWQLNAILPEDIAVCDLAEVPEQFNARHSAVGRTYSYFILNQPHTSVFWHHRSWWIAKDFDIEAAREAAGYLAGVHDFAAFTVAKEGSTVRDVRGLTVDRIEANPPAEIVRLRIHANAFLHHMVRLIVGTLAEVAVGKRSAMSVEEILKSGDVRRSGPRAPAKGLWLERVDYEPDISPGSGSP